jgi:uncharacterized Zn-finger protein
MVDVPRIKHGDRQTIDTLISEEAEMWDKAEDCRRMSKIKCDAPANVNIGKVGATSMDCPHCGASQPIATKSNEVTCKYCGKNYVFPKKVLDLP